MKYFIAYASTLLPLIAIDAAWLLLMSKKFYSQHLGHLFSDKTSFLPVALFYTLYALGLTILIVTPAIEGKYGFMKVFLTGALFGLVAYGTYDLTNQATLKNWPTIVTIVDLLWGSFVTGLVSFIGVYLTNRFA